MDEVRADPAGPLLGEHQRFTFDARQPANSRPDGNACALLEVVVHLGEPGVFERLAGSIDSVDDEGIDLALNLVVDALVRVETVRVILWLDLAGDRRLLISRIEASDR